MQDQGDRPVRPARPSLLSTEPQAGAEHQRILSTLDTAPAAAPAGASRTGTSRTGKSRTGTSQTGMSQTGMSRTGMSASEAPAEGVRRAPRMLAWGGLGALAAAGLLFLSMGDDGHAPDAVPPASPAPLASAVPASQAAPAAARPVPPPASTGAPAAAHTGAPAAAAAPSTQAPASVPVGAHDAQAVPGQPLEHASANPLAALAPDAPARSAHHDQLTQALEQPSQQPQRAHPADAAARKKHKADDKPSAARAAHRVATPKAAPTKAAGAARSKPKEQDSDVALLAALMSHMQPRSKPASPAEQLKVCRQYNAAGEAQCRARLCQGVARKEPACKPAAPAGSRAD